MRKTAPATFITTPTAGTACAKAVNPTSASTIQTLIPVTTPSAVEVAARWP